MKASPVLLALSLAFVSQPIGAQVIRGQVADAESRLRLRAVDVVLLDSVGGEATRATSDTAGMFELRAPRPGGYRLLARLLGFTTITSDRIELGARETVQVALQLSTQAIPVAPLVITARQRGRGHLDDFERRRARQGSGYFITQKQIDQRVVFNTSTLLVGVPGVTVRRDDRGNSHIMMPNYGRPCAASVYLNGVPLSLGSVDDFLIPEWVGGIEVYTHAGTAPIEFLGSNCGIVVFWTREPEPGLRWSWKKLAVAAGFVGGAALLIK